ncbi:DEAD/DEAH box helicase [Brachyspira aalborgi]|uniref:DEAD/DEAH box helicase n=1 Tax=Brachyspira aalborgi TaxID=29522 RepID=A0A5C8EWV0_9SPIR|nr:DEAD/DEAH box helicase [Brachyspira aalborgi]TXJ54364.1 DEAD/DEAH box helicase [Brachyspira aalborgi]
MRKSGIYPYLEKYIKTAIFEDKLVYSLFNLNINNEDVILHREQLKVLNLLLKGENIVLSAPTSFGKSYIIDALISIKKPQNVLIIVPTIALLDETRRRIYLKFKSDYNIITTSKQDIDNNNIFILTQERALSYIQEVRFPLNLFIVDEFYKIADNSGRASILQKIISHFMYISEQKYFLCPYIDDINENPFVKKDSFLKLDFNTVIVKEYKKFQYYGYKNIKLINLLKLIKNNKNIIYTNSINSVNKLSSFLINKDITTNDNLGNNENNLLNSLLDWLKNNYTDKWYLHDLIKKGIGIHNGQIHRCLTQIQLKLYNDTKIINTIIATSSLIEGVNTQAKNIILYSNLIARDKIDRFTYNNIKGRSGRMFKYYTGNIYLLEEPPEKKQYKLNIKINDTMILDINDNNEILNENIDEEQREEINKFKEAMIDKIGTDSFHNIVASNELKNSRENILKITENLLNDKEKNENKLIEELEPFTTDKWRKDFNIIFNILKKYTEKCNIKISLNNKKNNKLEIIAKSVNIIEYNWVLTISEIVKELEKINLSIENYFRIEDIISFEIYNLFSDINILQKSILLDKALDLSKFVQNLQNVFLPPHVYTLEEFGLPRMLSKTIDKSNIIKFDFNDNNVDINKTLERFKENKDKIKELFDKNSFDYYILKYFYDGISVDF